MAERASRMVGDLVRAASKAGTMNGSIDVRRSRDLCLILSIDGDCLRSAPHVSVSRNTLCSNALRNRCRV